MSNAISKCTKKHILPKKKKKTPTTSKGCKNEMKSLCDSAAVSVTLTLRSALTAHQWRHIIYKLANSPVTDRRPVQGVLWPPAHSELEQTPHTSTSLQRINRNKQWMDKVTKPLLNQTVAILTLVTLHLFLLADYRFSTSIVCYTTAQEYMHFWLLVYFKVCMLF